MAATRRKSAAAGRESRLADLAREWFADARETSAREDAEFAAWNKDRKKFTAGAGGSIDGDSGDGGSCD